MCSIHVCNNINAKFGWARNYGMGEKCTRQNFKILDLGFLSIGWFFTNEHHLTLRTPYYLQVHVHVCLCDIVNAVVFKQILIKGFKQKQQLQPHIYMKTKKSHIETM